jgi:hypothetical protein
MRQTKFLVAPNSLSAKVAALAEILEEWFDLRKVIWIQVVLIVKMFHHMSRNKA